jgi:hypothetical protein
MATAKDMLTTARIVDALRADGHAESVTSRNVDMAMTTTGFLAVWSGSSVIIAAILGDDTEGHPDSPGVQAALREMTDGYTATLQAAGWAVDVDQFGTGLTVTGRAQAA